MSNKLELIEKEAAEELDQLKVRITDYDREFRGSFAAQMRFAFLAGCSLLRAKEIVPHGKFMEWCETELSIKRTSTERYRKFADSLISNYPAVGNLKEVKLLGEGEVLTATQQAKITEAVHDLADGKTLTEMYRDLGVIRQPKKQEHHPKKMSDEEEIEAQKDAANDFGDRMCGDARLLLEEDDETLAIMDLKVRRELRQLHIALGKKIKSYEPKKKAAKKGGSK